MWKITIDYYDGDQTGPMTREESTQSDDLLSDAVEGALEDALLIHAQAGSYQITATLVIP